MIGGPAAVRAVAAMVTALTFAGCATVDPYADPPIASHLQRDDVTGYCARLFADIDRRIDRLGVRDAEADRVPGFPYLRVDRISEALPTVNPAQRAAWLQRLARLDVEGRTIEFGNAALAIDDVARCRALLSDADAPLFGQLRAAAKVPDRYQSLLRVLGLYPLTRIPFAAGVANWQSETRRVFATPRDQLQVAGQVLRYGPTADESSSLDWPLATDPLGVPRLSETQARALLDAHAPLLDIDVAGEYDAPGALRSGADDRLFVDLAYPTVYTRIAHTLFEGRVHLQLVYSVWFTERPPQRFGDWFAGSLDSLIWRVTLDEDGAPLVYDSIHGCGCYHLFFPTARVKARNAPDTLDEWMFAPQMLPEPGRGERPVLRVASATHYLQRVHFEPPAPVDVPYRLDDERGLAELPRPAGGTRSAYGPDGLVAGSERPERLLFWPMGIASAGQMRQWGHHATAFVGRRHFDDARLLEAYFERADQLIGRAHRQ